MLNIANDYNYLSISKEKAMRMLLIPQSMKAKKKLRYTSVSRSTVTKEPHTLADELLSRRL